MLTKANNFISYGDILLAMEYKGKFIQFVPGESAGVGRLHCESHEASPSTQVSQRRSRSCE